MSDHKEDACQDEAASGASGADRKGTLTGSSAVPGQGSGTMNAYDIPRYNSEGYVVGRPDASNDPSSAGNVQGMPVGGEEHSGGGGYGGSEQATHGQAMPGAMGHGSMNGTPTGPAMADGGGMGQAGYQVPPQGMAYTGMDPAAGQGMAGGQANYQMPPQGMAYGGMDPAAGQGMAGGQANYQVPPQGMAYAGMDPAAGQGMPGGQASYQVPPQGMAYGGMNPAYGQTMDPTAAMGQQPGFQPQPGTGTMGPGTAYTAPGYYQQPYPGDPQDYTAAGQSAPGNHAENYGRIADVVKDIANGEQPDMSKLAALYSGFDTQFWKGALIGAVLTVLLTSETVKTAVAGTFGGIFGAFSKPAQATTEADKG
mgnify:CR=1 FL=1